MAASGGTARRAVLWGVCAVLLIGAVVWLFDLGRSYLEDRAERQAIGELRAVMSVPEGLDSTQAADHVRDFIWRHSVHKIDDEFRSHWGNTPLIVSKMIGYARNERAEPPHMECSSRSGLAQMVLKDLGYRVRSVDVYRHDPEYPAHSFFEIFNEDTGTWEAQDVDHDVFWRKTDDQSRAGITDIISSADLHTVEPCRADGQCGWPMIALSGRKMDDMKPYYGLAIIIDRDAGERTLLVNRMRFDFDEPERTSKGNLTYCAYREKNCRDRIVFY